ncbi:unnamed protein product [Blumeria hordei]|uniref:Uncharacterized protein n=1 Tax=Blumeria hordei TaxID=2867405 RepID=A0A383UK52_BLUHO|nr:unnamed protein product [Blumeria hordei]
MMDLDDPENNPEISSPVATLDYNDHFERSSLGSALAKCVQTATFRVKEAENLFGNIVNALDQQCNNLTPSSLPENQRKALLLFLKDLSNVAGSHFTACISGIILEPTVIALGENERRRFYQPATTTPTYVRETSQIDNITG